MIISRPTSTPSYRVVSAVGSDENVSGRIQGEEIARLLNYNGNLVIIVGELATQAAVLRTEGVEKVAAKHPEMKIVGKQTADWRRNEAIDLMNNWLVADSTTVIYPGPEG